MGLLVGRLRSLGRRVGIWFFGFLEPIAGNVEFQDHAVVDEPIDGCRRGHGILEDLLPLAERQVAGQHHTAAFVAFGQQGEEDFHLLPALLYVAQVVDHQGVELRQFLDHLGQSQVPLGDKQLLHQQAAGREQHRSTPLHELFAQRTKTMALPRAGLAEQQQVFAAVQERSFAEAFHLPRDVQRKARPVEVVPRLGRGEPRLLHQSRDPAFPPRLAFQLGQLREILQVTVRLPQRAFGQRLEVFPEHRQPQLPKLFGQLGIPLLRPGFRRAGRVAAGCRGPCRGPARLAMAGLLPAGLLPAALLLADLLLGRAHRVRPPCRSGEVKNRILSSSAAPRGPRSPAALADDIRWPLESTPP